jgi:VCBS repeat-containing protein
MTIDHPGFGTVKSLLARVATRAIDLVPHAKNDVAQTSEDEATTIDVLANDKGGAAKALYSLNQTNPLVRSTTATTAHGATIAIVDGRIVYDPSGSQTIQDLEPGETITDTFTYVIRLANGVLSSATVTIIVTGASDGIVVTPNPETGGNDIELTDGSALTEDLGTDGVDNVTISGDEPVVLPANIENVTLTGEANVSVTGNDLSNEITGNLGDNTLIAGGGDDTVTAGDGDDYVDGGDGDDTLVAGSGAGDDIYIGGAGVDIVRYSSTTLGVNVDLAAGTGSGPEVGNDTISLIENVVGGSGADTIRGDAEANRLGCWARPRR